MQFVDSSHSLVSRGGRVTPHALELAKKLRGAERTVSEIEILEKLATTYVVLVDDIHAIETYQALAARAAHEG